MVKVRRKGHERWPRASSEDKTFYTPQYKSKYLVRRFYQPGKGWSYECYLNVSAREEARAVLGDENAQGTTYSLWNRIWKENIGVAE